jgi:hypothetical protein
MWHFPCNESFVTLRVHPLLPNLKFLQCKSGLHVVHCPADAKQMNYSNETTIFGNCTINATEVLQYSSIQYYSRMRVESGVLKSDARHAMRVWAAL